MVPYTGNLRWGTAVKLSGFAGRLLWPRKTLHHVHQRPGGALESSNKHSQFCILLTVSNWLDSSIGLSGLLLVISNLFAVPVSVGKLKWLNLGCEKIFFHGHILSTVVNARASLVDGELWSVLLVHSGQWNAGGNSCECCIMITDNWSLITGQLRWQLSWSLWNIDMSRLSACSCRSTPIARMSFQIVFSY